MQQLWLFNTLTRQKDLFAPIDKKNVRMYVCGPTVYDSIHIGNARPLIVFDLLFRLLRYLYGAEHVVYVRNITDVDDKINARAKARYGDIDLNAAIHKLTTITNHSFQEDAAALGCLLPSSQPRVTEYMEVIKAMIERLLQTKQAYIEQDHILFSVERFSDYGKLSGRSVGEMLAGARVEVAPYKRGDMDFVLWKPAKPGEPSWSSPGGIAVAGRPGWHIECSAMSMAELLQPYGGGLESVEAEKNVFDIHGGGIDLMFPHHENEIAQSCCSLGVAKMANFWLHNGYVQVDGKKMSKSENNFITVKDIIGTNEALASNKGNVARFAMLQTHYRSNFNWTNERYEQAHNELAKWQEKLQGVPTQYVAIDEFIEALCDDLNTAAAITHMREYFKNNELTKLKLALEFLGINLEPLVSINDLEPYKNLIEQRAKAIANKNWHKADEIRLHLQSKGIEVRDWKDESGARQTAYLKVKGNIKAKKTLLGCGNKFTAGVIVGRGQVMLRVSIAFIPEFILPPVPVAGDGWAILLKCNDSVVELIPLTGKRTCVVNRLASLEDVYTATLTMVQADGKTERRPTEAQLETAFDKLHPMAIVFQIC